MKYSEKLRDPRWQKKRLKIMERDGFTCLCCGDSKTTLNVHHKQYSGNPWDAEDEALETLCEPCHEKRSDLNKKLMMMPTKEAVSCIPGVLALTHQQRAAALYSTFRSLAFAIQLRDANPVAVRKFLDGKYDSAYMMTDPYLRTLVSAMPWLKMVSVDLPATDDAPLGMAEISIVQARNEG